MKKPIDLSPSLEHIERCRLGINEGLIQAVMRGQTSTAVAAAVRAAPEWAQYQNDMAETREYLEIVPGRPPPPLPSHLQDLIRRRAAAQTLQTHKSPEPGQIVQVDKLVTPRPQQLDAVLMAPLYVLLDAPAESPVLWHGWLAAGETDYAGWWDFVLQEQDEPFDPEASVIQLWNPVRLYLPMAGPVVGSLTPARLQALRSLAADFVVGDMPAEVAPWPGRVAARTTRAGLHLCTGSPLGGTNDPRHRYQEIYFEAAEAIREPARLALREMHPVPAGIIGRFLNGLMAEAARLAECLIPEPQVAVAMSDRPAEATPDLVWPDIARLRILDLAGTTGEGRIEVSCLGSLDVAVEICSGDILLNKATATSGNAAIVSWGNDATHLRLATPEGRALQLGLRDPA